MDLTLKRIFKGDKYTIGHLYIDGVYFCDTLELPVPKNGKKIKGKTAIPAGTYDIIITMSPRFKKRMPLILEVPEFDGVRIHSGNTVKDTAGCPIVGINNVKGMVTSSRKTFNALMEKLEKASEITIKIE